MRPQLESIQTAHIFHMGHTTRVLRGPTAPTPVPGSRGLLPDSAEGRKLPRAQGPQS